jgi:hypothetical protein
VPGLSAESLRPRTDVFAHALDRPERLAIPTVAAGKALAWFAACTSLLTYQHSTSGRYLFLTSAVTVDGRFRRDRAMAGAVASPILVLVNNQNAAAN